MKTFAFILFLVISVRISYSEGGWTILNTGTTYNLRTVFFIDTSTGFAGGDFGCILRTTNGGVNWQQIFISLDSIMPNQDWVINSICFSTINKGFAVGYFNGISGTMGFFFYTIDSGLSWTGTMIGGWGDYWMSDVSFADTSRGLAIGYMFNYPGIISFVMKTFNGGGTWQNATSLGYQTMLKNVFLINGDTAIAVGSSGTIVETKDFDSTWIKDTVSSLYSTQMFNSVFFTSPSTGYCTSLNGNVLKTTNGEISWNGIISTRNEIRSIAFLRNYPNIGYFSGQKGMIQRTNNAGASWFNEVTGTQQDINSLYFVDSLNGYAAGNYGTVLKTKTGGLIGVERINNEVPKTYSLFQNYPNPFNPSTNIKYQIPKTGFVKLAVYDILGKEISVLVNEKQNPGTYEINFYGSNYSSGVYFYKLTATNGATEFTETKRMVMVK